MHQNTPNYNSNIHFGPLGYPGGASGAQNLKIAVPGGYLKDRIWVLWNFCPVFGHLTLFWWSNLKVLTLVVYHTPLLILAAHHYISSENSSSFQKNKSCPKLFLMSISRIKVWAISEKKKKHFRAFFPHASLFILPATCDYFS